MEKTPNSELRTPNSGEPDLLLLEERKPRDESQETKSFVIQWGWPEGINLNFSQTWSPSIQDESERQTLDKIIDEQIKNGFNTTTANFSSMAASDVF